VTGIVRPAAPGDLDRIAGIFSGYVTGSVVTFEETPPTVAQWRQRHAELAERGLPFLVAEEGGQAIGYAYATPWRAKPAYRHTVEDTIYLDPAWTGKGWGGVLLGELLAACAAAGVRQVIAVIADTGEDASARLHRGHGFTYAGRLHGVGHKHGRWIDTVLMQRDLTAYEG
jgi:L-amino acid N-acyltransferase YncA